jgi:hypothetical protein
MLFICEFVPHSLGTATPATILTDLDVSAFVIHVRYEANAQSACKALSNYMKATGNFDVVSYTLWVSKMPVNFGLNEVLRFRSIRRCTPVSTEYRREIEEIGHVNVLRFLPEWFCYSIGSTTLCNPT